MEQPRTDAQKAFDDALRETEAINRINRWASLDFRRPARLRFKALPPRERYHRLAKGYGPC